MNPVFFHLTWIALLLGWTLVWRRSYAGATFLLGAAGFALLRLAAERPPVEGPLFLVHVTPIVAAYAVFAFAMGLSHGILWREKGRRLQSPNSEAAQPSSATSAAAPFFLQSLRLGVVLLGLGILFGGLWAQQAWGRFWGWDPKETWALITLLLYAVLLHGYNAGWWRTRGLAAGAIVVFQSVLFTWYGLNFLPANGLHSYGWHGGGLAGLAVFALAECVFLAVIFSKHRKKPLAIPSREGIIFPQ